MNNKLGGPRTEQGKARSSQNATKHELRSNKMFVLQNENPEAWQTMLDACVEEFQPMSAFERKLVEEIAFLPNGISAAPGPWKRPFGTTKWRSSAEAFAREYKSAG